MYLWLRSSVPWLLVGAFVFGMFGVSTAVWPSVPTAQNAESTGLDGELEIPRPDLSAMQPASRRKVEAVQQSIEKLLAAGDSEPGELAGAFGFLGQLLHAFEKLDAAASSYETARRLDPTDIRWSYYLGLIGRVRGDYRKAIDDFRTARSLAPDDTATVLRLADALVELGRLEEARIHFERLERTGKVRGGELAATLFGLGRIADLEGDPATAARFFERVIELQPEAGVAQYALGQAYRSLGEIDKARQHLALGSERPVGFSDSHVGVLSSIAAGAALGVAADLAIAEDFSADDFLGFVLSQLGSVPGASEQMKNMLAELDKSGAATTLQRARLEYAIGGLLVQQAHDQEAMEHFRRAVAGDPDLLDARIKLGNVLARTGRMAEALEVFGQALAVAPDNPSLLTKRATALVNLDRIQEAQRDLERGVEIDSDNNEGWRLLSAVRERAGDLEGGVAAMQSAIDSTDDPQLKMSQFVELGNLYYRLRRYESAARSHLRALRIDQTFVPALDRLASLLGQLKELDRSADVYARWIAVEPDNPAPRVGEATALILAGRFAEARDRLEAGLEVLPGNLDLMDILARHLAACPDPAVRDGRRAVELAVPVYQEVPTAESVETLAMALAEAGDFEEAVAWQKSLLANAGADAKVEVRATWRANLARYESGVSCCARAGEN